MRVKYAHLCQFALRSQDGMMTLVSIFDRIHTMPIPVGKTAVLTPFYFASEIAGGALEAGPHTVQVRLIDADGVPLMAIQHDNVTLEQARVGEEYHATLVAGFTMIRVPAEGDYEFELVVGGTPIGSIPFHVVAVAFPVDPSAPAWT